MHTFSVISGFLEEPTWQHRYDEIMMKYDEMMMKPMMKPMM